MSNNILRNLDSNGFYSDFQKEDMNYAVLIRSPYGTGKLKKITCNELPENYYLYTADDFPSSKTMEINNKKIKVLGYSSISYLGEPIAILVGPDEYVLNELVHKIDVSFNIEDLETAFNNAINSDKTETLDKTSNLKQFVSELNDLPSLDNVIDKSHSYEDTQTLLKSRTVKTGIWNRIKTQTAEERFYKKQDYVVYDNCSLNLQIPIWQENSGAFCYLEDKHLHIYAPIKWTSLLLSCVSTSLGISEELIIIHKTKTSRISSKGLWRSIQLCVQAALACYLSKKPIKLILSEEEETLYNNASLKTNISYKSAVTKEGKIISMDIIINIDVGCFNPFVEEIVDRFTLASCNYYKPENIRINTECHSSKNPPTSIGIKNLESKVFYAVENHIQSISTQTKLFPYEVRKINTPLVKTSFPFTITFDSFEQTFEQTLKSSDFNRKYAAFQMESIDRVEKESKPFFALPLRGIGLSSAYNISNYLGETCFSYDQKLKVTLNKDNNLIINTITPSPEIVEIWKSTIVENIDIKKENIIIDANFTQEEMPTTPEETISSISNVNELLKKCCQDIQKKRFREPLPIISQKSITTGSKKTWNNKNFTGCPYGSNSFAVTVVEVEIDAYTFFERIKGIWITINCGKVLDKLAAKNKIRLEIQQELARLVEGTTIPCDNYYIDFVEDSDKSGQIGDLVHNSLPAAYSIAKSLAMNIQPHKTESSGGTE